MVNGTSTKRVETNKDKRIKAGTNKNGIPRKDAKGTLIKLSSIKTRLNIPFNASCSGKINANDTKSDTPITT